MKKMALLILLSFCLMACAAANPSPSSKAAVYRAESSSLPSAVPSNRGFVTVTWTLANIRSGLGNDYPVVKYVQQGDKLTVIGESGDWLHVSFGSGRQGWISNRVVK